MCSKTYHVASQAEVTFVVVLVSGDPCNWEPGRGVPGCRGGLRPALFGFLVCVFDGQPVTVKPSALAAKLHIPNAQSSEALSLMSLSVSFNGHNSSWSVTTIGILSFPMTLHWATGLSAIKATWKQPEKFASYVLSKIRRRLGHLQQILGDIIGFCFMLGQFCILMDCGSCSQIWTWSCARPGQGPWSQSLLFQKLEASGRQACVLLPRVARSLRSLNYAGWIAQDVLWLPVPSYSMDEFGMRPFYSDLSTERLILHISYWNALFRNVL